MSSTSKLSIASPATLARAEETKKTRKVIVVSEESDDDEPKDLKSNTHLFLTERKESSVPKSISNMLKNMKRDGRTMSIRLQMSTIQNLTSSGASILNSLYLVNAITTKVDFTAIASLFDEFFVHSVTYRYCPHNKYNVTPGATWGTNQSTPLYVAPLHHGAPSYSSADALVDNAHSKQVNSCEEWYFRWTNVEKATSTVLTSSSTSAPLPTQSWCLTSASAAALYTGFTQVRANATFGYASATIGELVGCWDMTFRARV